MNIRIDTFFNLVISSYFKLSAPSRNRRLARQTTMTTATTQLSSTPSPVARSRSSQELASRPFSGRGGGEESESRALLLPPQSATMQNLAVIPNGGGGGANNGHIRKVSVETHESGAEDS